MRDMNCKQLTDVDASVRWTANSLQLWMHAWYEL